jgi:hypothetical protein
MLSNIRFFCHMCCYGMNWPSIRIKWRPGSHR